MSDDVPADGPDEHLRELLDVPPLDDVTRRRLVRRAVESMPTGAADRSRPRSRLALAVPVAAAVAIGLVVGAVVVTRPEDTTPTAASAASSAPTPQGDGERAAESSDAPALAPSESSAIADLGDLGAVTSADDLRTTAIVAQEQLAASDATSGRVLPCAETAPGDVGLAVIHAAGTATYEAAPVTVLVGRGVDGATTAVALTVDTCAPVLRTTLSG